VDALLLIVYLLLVGVTYWRSRSVAWTTVSIVAAVSVAGVLVNFFIDYVTFFTRIQLQFVLLIALAVPTAVAWIVGPVGGTPRRLQLRSTVLPVGLLLGLLVAVLTWWSEEPALLRPVGFLIGHSIAEDNAKWLDFGAKLASGDPVAQSVPLGGPLQLYLVFVATAMGVASQLLLGGFNEVMVAANTVIVGQFLLVVLVPLALAPLVESRINTTDGRRVRIPAAFIWTGSLILVLATLMLTAYGHLTLQWIIFVAAAWASTYLVRSRLPWLHWLTSIAIITSIVVWFPITVIGIVVLVGWLAVLIARVRFKVTSIPSWVALGITVIVAISLWEPLRSSFVYVASTSSASAGSGAGAGGALRAVASGPIPAITNTNLFQASGGTEVATPILVLLAVTGAIAGIFTVTRRSRDRGYVRLIPLVSLAGFALVLSVMDQWATGNAPNYGSLKFTFMAVIVIAGATLPVGLMVLDPRAHGMSATRWSAVGAVLLLLAVDPLLVRSVAAARPEQWSPPIPFDNPRSYWWPAEVNGTADQPIELNPIACVYLPNGAEAPSALLESQLSDAQRVYSCSRIIAGLAGEDDSAEPLIAWLRREWLTNTPAWPNVYRNISELSDSVLDRPVILLDDGSNVIGLESLRSLVNRFPPSTEQ